MSGDSFVIFLIASWGLGETSESWGGQLGNLYWPQFPLLRNRRHYRRVTRQNQVLPMLLSFITLFTYPSQQVFTENLVRARLSTRDWKPRDEQKASLYLGESWQRQRWAGNHREP